MPAAAPRRERPAPRPVTVVRSTRIAPNLQRVTFGGPGLDGFAVTTPTGHVKVFLPADGEAEPAIPTRGPDGLIWPDDRPPGTVRTYTPRRFDPERLELDVDFFLHGTGPASAWAARAVAGDQAAVAGQGRGYDPDPNAAWFVLAGDESALPAIGMILEALPESAAARVIAEVAGPDDEQQLPAHPTLITTWVHRGEVQPGLPLEDAIRSMVLPHGDGRVWVAGEASMIRRVRRHLLTDRRLRPEQVVTRGYWREGEPNHPDHDYGDDAS
jgi:NADPH-dependent ferric siderophore reductase